MPKTLAQYLAEHDGNHEAALEEAVRDVASREGENGSARAFRRTFEPVVRELGLPLTADGADALREAAGSAGDVEALREALSGMTEVLEGLGIDFDADETALQAQLDALPEAFTSGQAAAAERDGLKEAEHLRAVATASGSNADVLADRLKASGYRAEVRDVAATDTTPASKAVHVIDSAGKDLGDLKTVAAAQWPAYAAALYPAAAVPVPSPVFVAPQAGAGAGASGGANAIAGALGRAASTVAAPATPAATPAPAFSAWSIPNI